MYPDSSFAGLEHVGIYPTDEVAAEVIADWYANSLDAVRRDGNSSIFLEWPGGAGGRIEVMRNGRAMSCCHVAILVTDFDTAVAKLRGKGIELEEPKEKPNVKAVFLKEADPAGNRVHLIWRG